MGSSRKHPYPPPQEGLPLQYPYPPKKEISRAISIAPLSPPPPKEGISLAIFIPPKGTDFYAISIAPHHQRKEFPPKCPSPCVWSMAIFWNYM